MVNVLSIALNSDISAWCFAGVRGYLIISHQHTLFGLDGWWDICFT